MHRRTGEASALTRMLAAGNISRIELAARSGCGLHAISKLCKMDPTTVQNLPVHTVCKLAVALGCSPADLVPWLAYSPTKGLLFERGVKKRKGEVRAELRPRGRVHP